MKKILRKIRKTTSMKEIYDVLSDGGIICEKDAECSYFVFSPDGKLLFKNIYDESFLETTGSGFTKHKDFFIAKVEETQWFDEITRPVWCWDDESRLVKVVKKSVSDGYVCSENGITYYANSLTPANKDEIEAILSSYA